MQDEETRDDQQHLGDESPPAADDTSQPDPGDAEPPVEPEAESQFTKRRPGNSTGWYVALVAPIPEQRGDPLTFYELGYLKANDDDQVKRRMLDDPVHGPELMKLVRGRGVVLRAVPVRSWPKTKPSKVETTERLVVG